MSSDELKPCLYCGGAAKIEKDSDGDEYKSWEWYDLIFEHKENCIYAEIPASFNTEDELIQACNKRDVHPAIKEVYDKFLVHSGEDWEAWYNSVNMLPGVREMVSAIKKAVEDA